MLARALEGRPGVDMVAPFGNTLHVSGADPQALEAAIAPWRADPGLRWTPSAPGLEDTFIALMRRSPDELQ
jgi:ABC-2 type transport system ATP-binding protein